ncbi:MAG: hypothetical protein AB7I33_16725 [Gemmatimonadales bacterium]
MGRRGIKEYRAAEALALIAADRDHEPLVCPSCGSGKVERVPRRTSKTDTTEQGRITLHCAGCGRSAVYLATDQDNEPRMPPSPERPSQG